MSKPKANEAVDWYRRTCVLTEAVRELSKVRDYLQKAKVGRELYAVARAVDIVDKARKHAQAVSAVVRRVQS